MVTPFAFYFILKVVKNQYGLKISQLLA